MNVRAVTLGFFFHLHPAPDLNARLDAYFKKEFPDQEPGRGGAG